MALLRIQRPLRFEFSPSSTSSSSKSARWCLPPTPSHPCMARKMAASSGRGVPLRRSAGTSTKGLGAATRLVESERMEKEEAEAAAATVTCGGGRRDREEGGWSCWRKLRLFRAEVGRASERSGWERRGTCMGGGIAGRGVRVRVKERRCEMAREEGFVLS